MNARALRTERRARYAAKLLEARLLGAITPNEAEAAKKSFSHGFTYLMSLIKHKRKHL